ncbi:MAG: amidohydrolase [Clostridiales bacterium]|nr:amidohydrolase [Clostridiales bacterium]
MSKIGRFVVDGHIHCGKKDVTAKDSKVSGFNQEVESVDNSKEALYDMGVYGVDMGILLPSFNGTHSSAYAEICRNHPDKFRTCAVETELRLDAMHGKRKWTIDAAIKELDGYFSGPDKEFFVGVGEFAPGSLGCIRDMPSKKERFAEWCATAEFCINYDIPCYAHEFSSFNMEEPMTMLACICSKYPKFKLIIAHGGGSKARDIERAVDMAARFENVYLETGYWKAEYYEYALMEEDLGAAKLIWGGGDTGSHLWYPQITHGTKLAESNKFSYNRNNWIWSKQKATNYQPDWLGWATHQVHRLKDLNLCTQDEINLIVGGNAARLYKLPVPDGCTFASGRPALNIMPQEILDSTDPVARDGFPWPNGQYVGGTHTIVY